MNKFSRKNGFSQIILLVIISFLAIALPITTRLVQQNQENRSSAATDSTYGTCTNNTTKCTSGQMYFCSSGVWETGVKCPSGACSGSVCKETAALQTAAPTKAPTATPTKTSTATCKYGSVSYAVNAEICIDNIKYRCMPSGSFQNIGSCNGQSTCSSSACSTCSTPSTCSSAGCYWETQAKVCTNKILNCSSNKCGDCGTVTACSNAGCSWSYTGNYCETKKTTPTPTVNIVCSASNCGACTSASVCSSTGCYWETQAKVCTKSISCSASNCGACTSASVCSSAGCYWETQAKVCTNNPNPSIPIVNECKIGEQRCNNNSIQHCQSISTGINGWKTFSTCNSSQTCTEKDGTAYCKDNVSGGGGGGGGYIEPTPIDIGTTSTTGARLSFRFAFDGVAPANLSCMDNFKTVTLTVGKVGTTLVQEMTVNVTKTELTSSKGFAIFGADNVALGVGFSGATNVYARIKGQVHARMYYCVKSQSAKNTSQICNLALDGSVNNFYEYSVLGGDVNQDGIVNTADFSVIKNALWTTGCGIKSDLNGDAIVNNLDIKIFKVALEAKYDE